MGLQGRKDIPMETEKQMFGKRMFAGSPLTMGPRPALEQADLPCLRPTLRH